MTDPRELLGICKLLRGVGLKLYLQAHYPGAIPKGEDHPMRRSYPTRPSLFSRTLRDSFQAISFDLIERSRNPFDPQAIDRPEQDAL